jgi:ferredoxin
MRIIVDTDKCIGSGNCVLACQEIFAQSEDNGLIHVLNTHPSLTLLPHIKQAIQDCPALVFRLEDEQEISSLTIVERPSESPA